MCENLDWIENEELKLNETRWMAIYAETRVTGRMGVTRDARVVREDGGDANARAGEGEAG